LEGNGGKAGDGFRRCDPPAAVTQPVQAVDLEWSAMQSEALEDDASAEGGFHRSVPPPGVTQPVQVVAVGASLAVGAKAQATEEQTPANVALSLKEEDYSEEVGDAPDPEWTSAEPQPIAVLDNRQMYRIIREVAVADSGDDLYSAISADREYETSGHPAYHRRRFGLGFGLVLFTQASGHLGGVLALMRQRDTGAFTEVFGPHAEELLAVTGAATPEERLRPVGDEPLWGPGWIARFQRAGAVPAFQAAQNEQAIEGLFRPMLNVAFGLGLTTDRGLAMVFDRVVARGLGGGLRWVVQVAGVLRTAAQREFALEALGFNDWSEFQAIVGWTPCNGRFGPETHAALVGALRRQGQVSLPTPDQQAWQLAATATGRARARLMRLRDSTAFSDAVYAQGPA
jgi:hypothetical protein